MIYWLILILIIIFQLAKKKNNIFYLKLAFYIFLTGAVFRIITLTDISEVIMRTSFILFVVGLILSYFVGGETNKPK